MGRKLAESAEPRRPLPPGLSPEEQEDECIALAVDMAREQLLNHTASSQVICHFLKRSSLREQVEIDKLKKETELLQVKADSIKSAERMEQLAADAIRAFRKYNGSEEEDDDEDR